MWRTPGPTRFKSRLSIISLIIAGATLLIGMVAQANFPVGMNALLNAPKLTASDGDGGEDFGSHVALSGDTLVVGAALDNEIAWMAGAAYIFDRNHEGPDAWGQVVKLTADDGEVLDRFGRNVAISGDTVVVGALWNSEGGAEAGSAYIFERDHGGVDNWGQVIKLLASDAQAGTRFGSSVAVDGDTVVVGADYDDENGTNAGSAYVFERNQGGDNNWGQLTKLMAPIGLPWDLFGCSVALSQDTLVVGAYWDSEIASSSGAVYVFERNQGGQNNWGFVKKLTASDGAGGDYFGYRLSLSGDTLVVGAHCNDDGGLNSGSAYIFIRDNGGPDNWGQLKKLTAFDAAAGDYFGVSVAISGDNIVVGAEHDDDRAIDSGSVYIYGRDQGGTDKWGQRIKLGAADGASYDSFGLRVAMSDDIVAIGSPHDDDMGSDSGSVYILDGIPGISVSPTGGLTTSESGSNASFSVVLDSNPYAEVTIDLSSDNPDEGTVSPTSLTFNRDNWSILQQVAVTGVDDAVIDGNQEFRILLGPAQSNNVYYGLDPDDVSVTNADDDQAGVTVTPTKGLTTTETGGTAEFSVLLDAQPRDDVRIELSCSDATEGSISDNILVFSPGNWNQSRTITVTGMDDDLDDDDQSYTVTTSTCDSSDADYHGLDPADIHLVNVDNDSQAGSGGGGGGGGGCFIDCSVTHKYH